MCKRMEVEKEGYGRQNDNRKNLEKKVEINMTEALMQCLWAFLGTLSFGIIFNIRGKNLMYASLGGLLAWIAYLVAAWMQVEEVMCYFYAAVVISFYAECMAIYRKTPVTIFIVSGMIPLVPGGGIFYTMQELIRKNYAASAQRGLTTFAIAGCIALGILVGSFCVQLVRHSYRNVVRKKYY